MIRIPRQTTSKDIEYTDKLKNILPQTHLAKPPSHVAPLSIKQRKEAILIWKKLQPENELCLKKQHEPLISKIAVN